MYLNHMLLQFLTVMITLSTIQICSRQVQKETVDIEGKKLDRLNNGGGQILDLSEGEGV